MRVTALIVNWNTREQLLRCLASLQGQCAAVVVDNASADGSAQAAAEAFPDATIIGLGENISYAEGCNLAASCAQTEYLFLLNPDTVVPAGGVDALVRFLEDHPQAAIAAPRLVLPGGATQASVRGMPEPMALFGAATGLDRLFPHHPALASWRMPGFDYTRAQPAPQPMASAWMVPRAAWEAVGPFDPAFPLFWNDVDWPLRARQAGWEVWYTPEPAIRHEGGASTRQVKRKATRESHRALVAFYRKHYARRLGRPAIAVVSAAILLAGWLRSLFAAAKKTKVA